MIVFGKSREWVMSVRVDWEHENVTLINGAMKSGL